MSDNQPVSDILLAQLLCARMCHDLAGPVGAVVNGADLLAGDPSFAAEAGALLSESALAASARVKFFRAALGWNSGNLQGGEAARALLEQYLTAVVGVGCEITLAWDREGAGGMAKEGLQLLLNLGLLAAESLPRGGTLEINAGTYLEAIARGRNAAPREGVAEALALDGRALTPKSAQAYFTAKLALELGGRATLDVRGEDVVFRVITGR